MLKQQNSMTPMPNADPFAIDETIDEESDNDDEELSNDENFGANNQVKPSKKQKEADDFDFMQEFKQTQSKT